ncbi:glycerol-3-phosphate 1-O-acyltransferase PlsY [Acetomicrobium sp. UBA5826]|uniref:glycerol-3-phosphate 1-O-acyltransferase PlsY n=1 Tax=Acetomicrobium sp. UBA5826 TaxID=1946039 RepID=UPI002580306D|nr:glycerol-3-phosphate 1-O-acyltransferase PlsY [Acetomicrobium sp. UBA5826]
MSVFLILLAYLLGSAPMGYLVVKLVKGDDIRKYGSGNIGATNVGRVMGKKWAIAVGIFDITKGGLALLIARVLGVSSPQLLSLLGVVAVLGHNFPVWLKFKGGKGVATSFGVIFMFYPLASILGGVVWYCVMKVSRYVSLASMISLASTPIWLKLFDADIFYIVASSFLAFLTIVRHHANIRRLLAGTEHKVGERAT